MNKPRRFEYYKSLFQWLKINVIDLFFIQESIDSATLIQSPHVSPIFPNVLSEMYCTNDYGC